MAATETETPSGLKMIRRTPVESGRAGGRMVVLVHGAMDRATSMSRLMGRLPDWTVVSYDRRGYGGSSRLAPPQSFADQAEDLLSVVAAAVDASRDDPPDRPPVAFGHSFGGDVVLATMAAHPATFAGALLWEPPTPWVDFWPEDSAVRGAGASLAPEDRAEWFMRRMVGHRVWERLPESTREQRRSEGHAFVAEVEALAAGRPFDPARVKVPVIVGRGGQSRPHQRRAARELAASLTRAEMAEIAEASHGAHLTHPAEVAALVRRVGELTEP